MTADPEHSPTPPQYPPPARVQQPTSRTRSGLFVPRETPHCKYCGFSLNGLPNEGRCPECGDSYSEASARLLAHPPTVREVLNYLGKPLIIGGGAALAFTALVPILAVGIGVFAFAFWFAPVCLTIALAWCGVRLYVGCTAFYREVLPTRLAEGRKASGARILVSAVAILLVAAGVLTTMSCVLFWARCATGKFGG